MLSTISIIVNIIVEFRYIPYSTYQKMAVKSNSISIMASDGAGRNLKLSAKSLDSKTSYVPP